MGLERFDYHLPVEAIAQRPAPNRSQARMLVALDDARPPRHLTVADLPGVLEPGDLLVVNETRVIPARLRLRKATGGAVEVLLLEPASDECGAGHWEALVRPGRRVAAGTTLYAGDDPVVEVGGRAGPTDAEGPSGAMPDGRRVVRLFDESLVDFRGEMPLPPYIHQPLDDPDRYQTVFARRSGSVAAPTAGLHFDAALVERCRQRGVEVATVDLAVGPDTFRPIKASAPEDHEMHSESYSVPPATLDACARARRVVAVGTTTVRALESAAATGELQGRTSLFIHGRFLFRLVDVLLTNFHLPRSSLLLLVDAFCGDRWRMLYELALDEGYRFLSFGDAMLVSRSGAGSSA
ncbi:MAG TPA: tRNA preQ1(34) S-adenosylmethionine ribosyltransferase-isomerase QueA [Acidimicrobiales bacterium]|nr:tRNA preQ1(34) S-adenosylmethionine ribosyltransferase-isomerase QueA [Acidimicrobiales bacterium]